MHLVKNVIVTDFQVLPEILADRNTQHAAKYGVTRSAVVFIKVLAPQEL